MPEFTLTKHVAATPERVFAVATDFAALSARIPEIKAVEVLTPGPFGLGSKVRETRTVFGSDSTETFEVTAFEPGRAYTMTFLSCGAVFAVAHTFAPDAGGTRVELHMSIRAVSLFAKLISPLTRLMMGQMKKMVAKDLDRLAQAAEAAG